MECNNYRFGRRKISEQSREINKMLNLMNVDNVGLGYFRANISQQVCTRVGKPAHDFSTGLTRPLFLELYPGSAKNSRSAANKTAIARINCYISIVRVFVAHKHP